MNKLATFIFLLALYGCNFGSREYPTTMYRGDTARTGFIQDSSVSVSTVKWKFKADGKIFAAPLVTEEYIYFGSNNGSLYCLRKNGKLKWEFNTNGAINSTPAIFKNMVYFISADSNIYALNANNGRKKWEYATKGEQRFQKEGLYGFDVDDKPLVDDWDLFQSSPLIFRERVIVGGGDHYIYGLDAKDASLMFRFLANEIVHSSITGAYGQVYIGSWDGYLYALEAISGVELWRQNLGIDTVNYKMQGIQGTPAAADSLLIVPSRDSNLYALHVKNGDIAWKFNNDSSRVLSSPAVADGKVYFTTFDDHALKCLDLKTGELQFQTNTGSFNIASPIVVGDQLIVATLLGEVQIYNRSTGEKVWQWRTDGSREDPFNIISENGTFELDQVYPSDSYHDFKAGVDKILSSGAIVSQPVVYGDNLYITSTDSTLYVF